MVAARPRIFKSAGKQRLGRGFSRDELKKAGSNIKEAVKLGLPVDEKRKTCHDENVEAARKLLTEKRSASKPAEPQTKPKS